MIRLLRVPLILALGLSTTMVGCGSTHDGEPLEPSDAKLEETIERYCDIVVPCYPGTWEEPEHANCVAQQEEWAAKSLECREARFDFIDCIVELGSCEALAGQPCRIENNVASELRCDEL